MFTVRTVCSAEPQESHARNPRQHLALQVTDVREIFRNFWQIAAPFWREPGHWRPWAWLVGLVVLLLAQTGLAVLINEQTGEFISALSDRDADRFWLAVRVCLLWLVCAVPVYGFYYFFRDSLANAWRQWMTRRFLVDYFRDQHYYALNAHADFDNPDQRMADDINTFTQRSLFFALIGVGAVLQLLAFSGVLWSISRTLVWVLLAYAMLGTWLTVRIFGRPLIALNFRQIQHEADFRFGLIRVREHAESIALYRGEAQELVQVERRFSRVIGNLGEILRKQRSLNFVQSGYGMFAMLLPTTVMAQQVLSGALEVGSAVRAAGAFAAMLSAISLIVDNFENLSRFVASIDRLNGFSKLMNHKDAQPAGLGELIASVESRDELVLESLTLQTPDRQRVLIRDLSLVLPQGESLMVVGASGSGKSSLLRAIAGLWQTGSGRIQRPPWGDSLFLPQQPYVQIGILRDQLLYPHLQREVGDAELVHLLLRVRLNHLVDQVGGLYADQDWAKTLSLGEQQRLAFARVLLHRPGFVILDEATSALDGANEAHLYRELMATCTTVLSVGHRASLLIYHKQVLEISGNGQWCMHASGAYRFRDE